LIEGYYLLGLVVDHYVQGLVGPGVDFIEFGLNTNAVMCDEAGELTRKLYWQAIVAAEFLIAYVMGYSIKYLRRSFMYRIA
jgi:hypothetical protein